LEALIAYRRAHSEFESLRMEQIELKTEIQVAANMQKTLLSTEIPHIEGIDIGAISVPLHQMNGDYYHFITGNDGSMGEIGRASCREGVAIIVVAGARIKHRR